MHQSLLSIFDSPLLRTLMMSFQFICVCKQGLLPPRLMFQKTDFENDAWSSVSSNRMGKKSDVCVHNDINFANQFL